MTGTDLDVFCTLEVVSKHRRHAAVQASPQASDPSFADILSGRVAAPKKKGAWGSPAPPNPVPVLKEEEPDHPGPRVGEPGVLRVPEPLDETPEAPPVKLRNNVPSKPVPFGEFLFAQLQSTSTKAKVKAESVTAGPKRSPAVVGKGQAAGEIKYHKGKTRQDKGKKLSTLKKDMARERSAQTRGEGEEEEPAAPPSSCSLYSKRFREYCDNVISKELNSALLELMAEIHRFQDRLYHKDQNKARQKRRFVCGLREVGKMVSLGKAVLVVLAPNINAYACLDLKMDAIMSGCLEKGVPYFFALNRHKLGKSLLKPGPVSAVAVLNYQGAESISELGVLESKYGAVMEQRLAARESFAALEAAFRPQDPDHYSPVVKKEEEEPTLPVKEELHPTLLKQEPQDTSFIKKEEELDTAERM